MAVQGFEAMGKPIPAGRMEAAYRAVKDDMAPGISTEDAMTLVGRVAGALERDEPYLAQRIATNGAPFGRGSAAVAEMAESDRVPTALDVTGAYRLMALLLTGGE